MSATTSSKLNYLNDKYTTTNNNSSNNNNHYNNNTQHKENYADNKERRQEEYSNHRKDKSNKKNKKKSKKKTKKKPKKRETNELQRTRRLESKVHDLDGESDVDYDTAGRNDIGFEEDDGPVVVNEGVDEAPLPVLPPSSSKETRVGRRYDSDDDDDEIDGRSRNPTKHRRYDSDDESDGLSRNLTKRRRYDSDDDEDGAVPTADDGGTRDNRGGDSKNEPRGEGTNAGHRKRYDSDDDEEDPKASTHENRQPRNDDRSDTDGSPYYEDKRREFDRTRSRNNEAYYGYRGNDAKDGDEDGGVEPKPSMKKKRYDSSSDEESPRMTSGHSAGLHDAAKFRSAEARLRSHETSESKTTPAVRGETVYRDSTTGARVAIDDKDKDQSMKRRRQEAKDRRDKDETPEERAKRKWRNMGAVQKETMAEERTQREKLRSSAFARTVGDVEMEEWKKDVVRDGDPMASSRGSGGGKGKRKKVYSGPQGKPNRYSIPPGYRWDGVDRGNGFEDLVLAQAYGRGRKAEDKYKWSCADM